MHCPAMSVVSGTIDITPPLGTVLSGWAGKRRTSKAVADALEVNFLAIRLETSAFVLLSSDTLFGARALEEAVADAVRSDGTLADVHVVSSATHTHFAPTLEDDKSALGESDPRWRAHVFGQVCQAVCESLQRSEARSAGPGGWQAAAGEIPLAVSRRKRWRWPVLSRRTLIRFPGVVMAPEPANPIDRSAHLAIISGADGQPLALLARWSAHPTVFPGKDHISPDYIGVVRDRLRATFGNPHLPILFLQGFAGDIRPDIATRAQLPLRQRILRGPGFPRVEHDEWQAFADAVAAHFVAMAQSARGHAPQPLSAAAASVTTTERPLDAIIDGETLGHRLALRHVRLAETASLLFVSAEPSSALAQAVHRHFPDAWPVGYAGDAFGYWPTSEQSAEGGYEGGGFFPYFGLSGRFRGNCSEVFDSMLSSLAAQ